MRQAGVVRASTDADGHGCTRRDPAASPSDDLVNRAFDPIEARTGSGSWTSPNTPPAKARCISPSCSTPSAAGSWAGRSPTTSAPSSSSTPCRWPSGDASPPRVSHRALRPRLDLHVTGRSVDVSAPPACSAPWAPSATASTTAWPRASSAPCNSSSSTSIAGHTRKQLALAIFDWIEAWYNPRRRHTYCKMLSPIDYETAERGMITATNPSAGTGEARGLGSLRLQDTYRIDPPCP